MKRGKIKFVQTESAMIRKGNDAILLKEKFYSATVKIINIGNGNSAVLSTVFVNNLFKVLIRFRMC